MNDEPIERRQQPRQLRAEKSIALVISGAALALTVFSAIVGAYDQLQRHLGTLDARVAVLDANIGAIGTAHAGWVDRIVQLDRDMATIRDRSAMLAERLVRCESRSGGTP